jgi:hypothetical protein
MEQGLVVFAVDLVWAYAAVLGALLGLIILCSSRMWVNVRCIVVGACNTVSSCMLMLGTYLVTQLIKSNGTSSILDTARPIQIWTDVKSSAIYIVILEDLPGDGEIWSKHAGVSVNQFIYIKNHLWKLWSVDSLLLFQCRTFGPVIYTREKPTVLAKYMCLSYTS